MTDNSIVDDEVPVVFVNKMLDVAADHGCAMEKLLQQAGFSRNFLANKKNHISNQAQIELIKLVLEHVKTPAFGFLVGQHITILDWGILGYAFISSPNMRKAWETFSTYQRLNGPMVNLFCREEGDEGIITAIEAFPLGAVHEFAIEEWLAETRASFYKFEITHIRFTSVRVTHDEPAHAQMYKDLFKCPILFNEPTNEIRFPAELLNTPFNLADESVAELCIRQCAEVMKHLVGSDPIVEAVHRVLLSKPGISPTLERVADHLHFSSRTLRRRLHEAGASYKNILADIRLGLAAEYLRSTRMLPKEIAYFLSYSSVTSFHRAFKSRFQMTPQEYRKQSITEKNKEP